MANGEDIFMTQDWANADLDRVLFTQEQIAQRVQEVGKSITADYQGKDLLVVGVLKGATVFFSDLVRQIHLPLNVDFIAVSSYGSGTNSSGEVRLIKDLDVSLDNRNVLIVEDILDTGLTLRYLREIFLSRNPASVRICAFLDKAQRRVADIQADYVGYEVPDYFVVGYGLDYNEQYRNLSHIAVLKSEVYTK